MESIKFEHTKYLWALLVILAYILLFWYRYYSKKKKWQKLGTAQVREILLPEVSPSRMIWKNIFLIIASVFLIIALANPQVGAKFSKVKIQGAEIIIAIDVSNSMEAEDIKPSRLAKAKQEVIQLLGKTKTDRVGLIVFAGKSFIPVPLTTDYAMLKMYLRGVSTDIISTQGTDIGGAIKLATSSFSDSKKNDKAIILITDGEDHEKEAIDLAKKASEKGISIHTIGLGKKEGVPLPVYNRYGQKEFRKDKAGNVVVSKLNEQLLAEIASAGNGKFILANNYGLGLDKIYDELKGLEKTEFDEKVVLDYEDDFQFYLWFALAFLILEFIILNKKNPLFSTFKFSELKI
jgi:Ca-activated chloride channel family protein